MKTLKCKSHDYGHHYTVCPVCAHQYCARIWPACPATPYHGDRRVPAYAQVATPEHG